MHRILFVCMGNICRSPAAENVMRKMVEDRGIEDQFQLDSCGTIAYHQGEAPDSRMRQAAAQRGLEMVGQARGIRKSDFEDFDHIFTMDNANYEDVISLAAGQSEKEVKVKKFCDYVTQYEDREVPDPYYGGDQGFVHVLDLLEDGCSKILKELEPKA